MSDTILQRPEPRTDDFSQEWFEAAKNGKLLIQRSPATGDYYFYPRWLKPGDLNEKLEWHEAKGTGTVYSFTVVNWTANQEFLEDCPYVFAVVALDEGPHMTTRIVDVPPADVVCDMPVKVDFRTIGTSETVMPVFTAVVAMETVSK